MPIEAEIISPAGKGGLLFRRLHGRESLGALPEYRLELLREIAKGRLESGLMLGKKACVAITLHDGTEKRYIDGHVVAFESGGVVNNYDIYYIELRPWLWQLTLGADCAVFQDMSVLDILTKVFEKYSSSTQIVKQLGSTTYEPRPYTVQYRESDFNFVSRLMEEEGIYYYFRHGEKEHKLVLCNGPTAHQPMSGGKLLFAQRGDVVENRNTYVTKWWRERRLRSVKFVHTDYAAEAPATDLLADALWAAPYQPKDFEVFDYPGGHDDGVMATNTGKKSAAGKAIAKRRTDVFHAGHDIGTGQTENRNLAVGTTFDFDGHPDDDGGYLVTGSVVQMEFAGYESSDDKASTSYTCRFTAVPKAVPFQPEPTARAPLVHGPQTAVVVGPSGDEIFTDKYGRVKVQFHWDRVAKSEKLAEKSSCWVRVSQPWASKQFGVIALPRVGDEVVVDFLEGDPDRPLITGRVYNGTQMPPWELPTHATVSGIKSQSSKGGSLDNANELRFDDKKGSEYVWLQAEKDFHRLVKNDVFDRVMRHLALEIEGNAATRIDGQLDTQVGKQASLKVGADVHADLGADLLLKVGGAMGWTTANAIDIKGGAAIALSSGSAMNISSGAKLSIDAQAAIHIKAAADVVIEGMSKLTIKVGGSSVVLGPDGVSITGPIVKINSGGAAGAAGAATKAQPAAPQAPVEPQENKDPLAG